METQATRPAAATEPSVDAERAQAVAEVEGMSEEEMEAVVMQQIERLKE